MARVACLWVPDLCVRAHLRLEPELASVPLVLTAGAGRRATVIACSSLAVRAGIVAGLTAAQARIVCDGVVLRRADADAESAAVATLADVAGTVSARVEVDARHRVFLDCDGGGRLWASEAELASVLATRAERCGMPAWVGVADAKTAAWVAAHESHGVRIVPPGRTREFL